jgi:ankyrin repeat protein
MLGQITEETLARDVKARICSKTDINMKNALGYTALHIAAENRHAKSVDLLVKHNADVHILTKESRFSCLHCAALGGNSKILEFLINEGAPLEARDRDERSLLHIAASQGNAGVLGILSIRNSALLEAKDNSGNTPLHAAASAGHSQFVKALLQAGVDVNVLDANDISPLALTKESNTKTILRSHGAGGWTPLMIAAEQGGEKFERLLKAMDCLQCVKDKEYFPSWFRRRVCFYAALTEHAQHDDWIWGGHEPRNLLLTEKGLKISKERDYPDYSCAVGNKVLVYGIHRWELKVDKVSSMWMGITRGIEENNLLDQYPGAAQNFDDVYMLVFHSNGGYINFGKAATFEVVNQQGYTSGQQISFELDMFRHTLSVKINGKLFFLVSGVDDQGVRPYVCMDYSEAVTLVSRKSMVAGDVDSYSDVPGSSSQWVTDPALATVDSMGQLSKRHSADSSPISALGRTKFSTSGAYSWAVQVKNVQEMWIGIAKGDNDRLWRASPIDFGAGDHVLALGSSGALQKNVSGSIRELNRSDSGPCYSSGQKVEVMVNVPDRILKVRVDGMLIRVISGVDLEGFQPYVCIRRSETVILQPVACREMKFDVEKATWKWGAHERQNLKIGGDGQESVTKGTNSPDFSSVVGSEELEGGIHTWSMKVDNVGAMWVGIARNAELDKQPSDVSGEDAYVVAFCSDGSTHIIGSYPSIDAPSSYCFSSGQTVKLELDTLKFRLLMYIDGTLAVTASKVDCRAVRPYVCMDEEESVTLGQRSCSFRAVKSLAVGNDDWHKGFDNSCWSEDIDEALIKHPLAGPSKFDIQNKGYSSVLFAFWNFPTS